MENQAPEKLLKLLTRNEDEIIEYKVNNKDHERIGKYISALANSSAILNRQFSYLIWGIDDETKEIIGTKFYPKTEKHGGEPFITWLERMLDPRITIQFEEYEIDEKHIVVLVIHMNAGRPVAFSGERYIRSGSSLKNLKDYPEKERDLWKSFEARSFEKEYAKTACSFDEIKNLLSIDTYLKMLGYFSGATDEEIITYMLKDGIIVSSGNVFNLTNMGAFVFAKNLNQFGQLASHALRVIRYSGTNKLSAVADVTASKGAAVGFEGLLNFINEHLPRNPETLKENGQITSDTDYPPLVIREIVANQIVHQDFSVKGSSPTIEIYDNRVVFTNPGAPLNKPERLLDLPPYSRNEDLANLFRKMHLVESRGSGIDKIVLTLEMSHLPAPDIAAKENFTVVTLYQRRNIQEMENREKINAIYYHAAILYTEDTFMTNRTLRERFGLNAKQSSIASKLIALALANGKIKVYDENAGNKNMQYIPFWGIQHNE
ncbi:ATP-binding protein [Streptococcus suis]